MILNASHLTVRQPVSLLAILMGRTHTLLSTKLSFPRECTPWIPQLTQQKNIRAEDCQYLLRASSLRHGLFK